MKETLKYITLVLVAIMGQIMVDEFINIWPLVYIATFPLFVISIPINTNIYAYLLISFFVGLGVDASSDGVLGLNAAACVAMAFLRKPILKLFYTENTIENMHSVYSNTWKNKKFFLFCSLMYIIFFAVYVLFDNFGNSPILFSVIWFSINIVINVLFALLIEVLLVSKFISKRRG